MGPILVEYLDPLRREIKESVSGGGLGAGLGLAHMCESPSFHSVFMYVCMYVSMCVYTIYGM